MGYAECVPLRIGCSQFGSWCAYAKAERFSGPVRAGRVRRGVGPDFGNTARHVLKILINLQAKTLFPISISFRFVSVQARAEGIAALV